jgi:diguanylate cyclase (GGDEF)-like protein
MSVSDPNLLSAEDSLTQDEKRIDRAAVGSISLSTGLTMAVVGFFVVTQADQAWQYFIYPGLAALPLLFGALAARHVRHMHVSLLRAHQARLVMRTIELEKMASHDELTDLYNRRYFYERFQGELARTRDSRRTLALITLDIDGLKKINDEYGHAVGDVMIANLARVIDKHIRTSDVPARLGGDEFAILMPETDKRGAFSLAQRLWAELEEIPMYEHEGIRLLLNVSIGVSGYPWGGEDIDEMMHWADADMYANKVSRRLPQRASPPSPQTLKDDRFNDPDWM